MDDRRRPPVTLEHVARVAGVSRATASRVLTGSGPSSAEARRRVQEVAGRLGYVADPVARALVHGRGTRLVVAATATAPDALECAYLSRVVATTAAVCAGQGLGVALEWLPLGGPEARLDGLAPGPLGGRRRAGQHHPAGAGLGAPRAARPGRLDRRRQR